MTDKPVMTDEDRADLIAYLDGELDEQAARALEARLSRDPQARAEADAYRQTWELLDYLPKAEPSSSFTHRTLDRIAPVGSASGRVQGGWRSWAFGLAWAAAVLLAVVGGYLGVRLVRVPRSPDDLAQREQQQMLRDLRVVEHLPLYQYVDDIEFLRSLDHPDLFGDDSVGW